MTSPTMLQRQQSSPTLRFVGGVVVALLLAMLVFTLVMRPPSQDLRAMAMFLSITALISVVAGYGAYRLGWISRSPRLSLTLLAGYGLATLLTFLNVGFSARLMFASEHDLLLAGVLLVFAGGIAMSLGYFLSAALTDKIKQLNHCAQAIADGDLSTRVPVTGTDEVAQLGQAFNDMAEQLQVADRKQRELDQLRRDLIAWVSHDLRTPLTSTRVIIEALADGIVDDPATVQRYLRTAQRDMQSLSILIDDLFALAQMDAGGLQIDCHPNAISDLISDTINSLSALAEQRQLTLTGGAEPGVDPVLIDAQKVSRVLSNLVGNALRHTPSGGDVQVQARPAGQWVEVEVSDNGYGINPEDLPHIFERFYRGEKSRSRSTGGSGLGLAIAHGIVKAHGGRIWAESEPGQGTTFCFTVPRA